MYDQKKIGDRLRHYKTKTWVEMLKASLNKYNNQIHTTTRTTPNNAHNLDKNKSDIERKAQ
jgi:hypothetical protein